MNLRKFLMILIVAPTLSFTVGCNSTDTSSSTTSYSTSVPVDPMKNVLKFYSQNYQRERCWFVYINDKDYEGEIVIPDYVEDENLDEEFPVRGIINGGFADSKITKITFPKHLLIVENFAFQGCHNLKEVVTNDELKTISMKSFEDCEKLETISFPDTLVEIKEHAFDGCEKLNVSHWSNSLKTIGSNAFNLCKKLDNLTLSNSIQKLGNFAFSGTGLVNVSIADDHQVNKIENCFYYCPNLKNVYLGTGFEEISDFYDCASLKTIVLPEGLKKISFAFDGTTDIKNVSIPSSIERIEKSFENCTSLLYSVSGGCRYLGNASQPYLVLASAIKTDESAEYDDNVTEINVHDQCRVILKDAFKDFRALFRVTLGNNVYSLEESCFAKCYDLTHINLVNSIKVIGRLAFEHCYSLREITLPNQLEVLEEYTFYGCVCLRSVTIGSWLREIGYYAFGDCASLQSIDIKNVITIKGYAFEGCCNLFEVKSSSLSLEIGSQDNGYVAYYAKQILTGSTESKISTDVTGFYHYYTDGSDKYLLSYTGGAVNVTVPATVTVLAPACFYNHGSEVHTINVGTNVKALSFYCFATFQKSLTTINYDGTKAEWNALDRIYVHYTSAASQLFGYMAVVPSGVTVHCSNGDI